MEKNDALGGLTEELREQVRDWIEEGKTIRQIEEMSEKPAPEGLGVKVSRSAVGRFAKNEKKAAETTQRIDDTIWKLEEAKRILQKTNKP